MSTIERLSGCVTSQIVIEWQNKNNQGFIVSPGIVLVIVFSYIFVLFFVARLGDKQHFVKASWARHPAIYALALGVYCTSWTFYGLVGTASNKGWSFLPILLGPVLLFTVGFPVLQRIYTVCQQEHIHSIADFIASRYGKRQGVAATVSLVVLLATIPYIALQLKAVSDTLLLTVQEPILLSQDLTFLVGLSMIAFSLLFGAKRLDMSGYHSGLMSAIAFESAMKFIVFVVVAIFALRWLPNMDMQAVAQLMTQEAQSYSEKNLPWLRFIVETILAVCAIFCLPRMFHVTFVECLSPQHLSYARWGFTAYLLIICLCIVIIAATGNALFATGNGVSGDDYMIALPISQGLPWLGMLAFLGGFSAATAMIIVATVTLSQMLSNDVILPLLIRRQKARNTQYEFSRSLIFSRRLTVILVVIGAYVYQSVLAENAALTSIGLIAFALVVQLAPAILFGLYWRRGNATGLYMGLTVGVTLWFYTLMIPLLAEAGLVSPVILQRGLFDFLWLRPEYLFNVSVGDSFTRGVIISLSANILFYCWYSVTSPEKLVDRMQAAAFTNLEKGNYKYYDAINLADLRALLNKFLGEPLTNNLFSAKDFKAGGEEKQAVIERAQKSLAGVVGVASSQAIIQTLYSGKELAVADVANLFGETTKALQFNQEMLSASFENISSGISVVDSDLRLIAWNQRYEDMFSYPEGLLHIGCHVSDIMRFNGQRGMLGHGDMESMIRKRLSYMSQGKAYRVVRFHDDDMVIEIKGQPLPNGGYVTTYDDITEFINIQKGLEDANANLEQHVFERTQKLEEANNHLIREINQRTQIEQELRKAKKQADEANALKTKFLALASHDIMQPLNAASLYASALMDNKSYTEDSHIITQLKSAIQNTESIISTLLEVSKLDSGGIQPNLTNFRLHDMLSSIVSEASVQLLPSSDGGYGSSAGAVAASLPLTIRYCKTSVSVFSDRHYLHRIVQNFVSNAIKYTQQGKILLGCRRVILAKGQPGVEICVLDTGAGIAEHEKTAIFDDFYRIHSKETSVDGIGLGLSVVARFSELLSHPVYCRSQLKKGSCFSVVVPLSDYVAQEGVVNQPQNTKTGLEDLHIVYVDDEKHNVLATSTLLETWGCRMTALNSVAEARSYLERTQKNDALIPDVLLMDYQLDEYDVDGLALTDEMTAAWKSLKKQQPVCVCIISAATELDLPDRAVAKGFQFLRKPVKPARLRALLTQFKE